MEDLLQLHLYAQINKERRPIQTPIVTKKMNENQNVSALHYTQSSDVRARFLRRSTATSLGVGVSVADWRSLSANRLEELERHGMVIWCERLYMYDMWYHQFLTHWKRQCRTPKHAVFAKKERNWKGINIHRNHFVLHYASRSWTERLFGSVKQ